ncbi:unnamed protein product [Rotaria sp. Silwood1]|nr:unnamed protein product [Rotaria sp. Silwood1]CAF3806545.1 unnamed protein product [Rotaria sp. Silwood1]CAF3817234.1 unnamed protein product [Rotaria sp. Silwood1]CAF3884155.1 unnamed protein product [Rotaria sp. Silwood1]CAF4900656.1 unnamed protein product [Rotaria sp. Silwood1]
MNDSVRKKEPVNILFCGHVDAGKSTIGGQLLYLTGRIDRRTLEKYQNEARDRAPDSLPLSCVLDTNEEERERGITIEVGRAWFETQTKHFTILDAPGHRCLVPNMIGGASQADIAILVISARKGEFETGFERGGQTREHIMLVKIVGVRNLIVLVNKMDDPTVKWSEARYREIEGKLSPYLKMCGFKLEKDTIFIPCSGMSGAMLIAHPGPEVMSWYTGPTFIKYLDGIPSFDRNIDSCLRMPIVGRYKDMGVIVLGKIESGQVQVGDRCLIMPNRIRAEVTNIYYEDIATDSSICGENVRLKLKNVEEEEISPGFVLCDMIHEPCHVGRVFDAQVTIIDYDSIISIGYSAVLHLYTTVVKVELKKLISLIDRKTGNKTKPPMPFIKQDQTAIVRFELSEPNAGICIETYKDFPKLGRFILREDDRTIAIGKVLKINP